MKALVDTGFWIAYIDGGDRYHSDATEVFPIAVVSYDLITSNFIIYETITYLNCSLKSHQTAISFLEIIEEACHSEDISVVKVDERLQDEALDIFRRFTDKDFSFVDCTSFAIMSELGIQVVLGFDEHFRQMGYGMEP